MPATLSRIVVLLVCLASAAAAAQEPGRDGLPRKLGALVREAFPRTKCPGLSVAVAEGGSVVFSEAYGLADLENGVPLTARSLHRLASLSKPVTGTIIMDLVESGRLSLDAPVRKYLPELPASYEGVTVRHLLTHQAGVRAYRDLEEVFSVAHYPTSRDAAKAFSADPLLFAPGKQVSYSTYGFTLLGAAAEAATGRTFQELSADFFARHRLEGFALDDPLTVVPRRVRGYRVDEKGAVFNARAYDASNKYPAGGFVSSAEDYLRFVLAVGAGRVLRPESLREMWTANKLPDGTPTPFGLGWGLGEVRGRRVVAFNGLQPTSATFMRYFPEAGAGVVMACNAEGARDLDKLLDDILALALPPPK